MNRWWTPADATAVVLKALATERAIRARHRETVRIAHRQPWLIGSVDAQQVAVARARAGHTESVERTRGLTVFQRTHQRQRAA